MFSSRASRLLSSCLMKGVGSLDHGDSGAGAGPACGGGAVGSAPTQAASTAAAPPMVRRRRKGRRPMPRPLAKFHRDSLSCHWDEGPGP